MIGEGAEARRALAFAAIERWYAAALDAVEPASVVERAIRGSGRALLVGEEVVPVPGRLLVVGVGKAAVAMARGAEQALGDLVDGGLVITKDGHLGDRRPGRIAVREASHPIPDERGVAATEEMLALLAGLGPEDVVVALISGGGSALLEAPRPPVTLADLAGLTDALLRAGAPIQVLNAVRRSLSRVKAGGLRRAAPAARFVTLILSDVLGNDPRTIASGPTVRGEPDAAGALALLRQLGLEPEAPARVIEALSRTDRGAAEEPDWSRDLVRVVGDNGSALEAATKAAAGDRLSVEVVWRDREGEASVLGREWVASLGGALAEVDVLLGGGEATVTVRGDGIGGRNTEFALAAALALAESGNAEWVVASLATDGQDGPTGVAGAIGDAETIRLARAAGVDPEAALKRNDSLAVFEAAGGVVAPGPTGTNVNDLYFALRTSAVARFAHDSG